MILKLTNEQIEYIVDMYGSNKNDVIKIVEILNDLELPFYDEDDFIVTVCTIASIIETEKFERTIGKEKKNRTGHTLSTAVILVLEQKFNNDELYDSTTVNKIYNLKNPVRA